MSRWNVGEALTSSTRNPDTLANTLARFAVMAQSHDLRVRLALRGGGSRTGRIVRREIRLELYEQDRDIRWRRDCDRVSSIVLHLDDGGSPLPLNNCRDIERI